jgi:hypothetical protein
VWLCEIKPLLRSNLGDYMLPIRRARIERERTSTLTWWNSKTDIEPIDVWMTFYLLYHAVVLSALVVNIVVSMFWVISVWGIQRYYGVAEIQTAPKPAVTVAFQPQVVDKQETDFGPWQDGGETFEKRGQPTFLNLALLSDTGTMKYSRRFVGTRDSFAIDITSDRVVNPHLTSTGQIAFHDDRGNAFTLNPWQAFLIEGYKTKAFMFDHAGRLMSVPMTTFHTTEVK